MAVSDLVNELNNTFLCERKKALDEKYRNILNELISYAKKSPLRTIFITQIGCDSRDSTNALSKMLLQDGIKNNILEETSYCITTYQLKIILPFSEIHPK